MTVTISGTTDAWINSLTDFGVRSDMQSFAADGSLAYSDVVQLLEDIDAQGVVTSAEFSDLQTIVANFNIGLTVGDYVASELTQIVDGNPANAFWNDGSTTATPLGNLAVGTTPTQLQQLIGKWLLGTDLPDPTSSDEPGISYATFNLPLYGATAAPVLTDISQGDDGDCEVVAATIDMLENHLSSLESMIVDDGDGVYGVRFFINGQEIWETVNNELPAQQYDYPTYLANMNAYNAVGTPLWADLIEKAYAQLSATGEIDHPAVNSYGNISGDFAQDVLANFTGASNIAIYSYDDASYAYAKQIIVDAVQSGEDVIVETGFEPSDDTYDSSGHQEFVDSHAFAVVGYDAATGDFILRNPWGLADNLQGYLVQFEASMADVAAVQADFAVDNSASSAVEITVGTADPQEIPLNGSIGVSSLFSVVDTAGRAIQEYMIQVVGEGALMLGGAANMATAAETAIGEVVVAASQLADVSYAAGATAGGAEMLLSAFDGSVWSPTADIALSASSLPVSVVPTLNVEVAPSGTLSLADMLDADGDMSAANSEYQIQLLSGGGAFNVDGAQRTGTIDIYGWALSEVTYTAGAAGPVDFVLWAYNGSQWSGYQQVTLNVGATAAAAIQAYDAGNLPAAYAVADNAANIFANLDGLQSLVAGGATRLVETTDTSTPTEALSWAQFQADSGVLSILDGAYALALTGSAASIGADFDALNADARIASITLSDSGVPSLTLAAAQKQNDTSALSKITNAVFEVLVGGNQYYFANTSGGVDVVNAANATITVTNATAAITGGGDIVNLVSSGDTVTLAGSAGSFDTVNGSNGTININSGGAAYVYGTGDKINVANGGTLSIAGGQTLTLTKAESFSGVLADAGVLDIAGGSTTIHSGAIVTVTNLAISGASTGLTIGTIAAYAGNLTESAGTITLTSANALTLTGTDSLAGMVSTAGSLAITGGHTTLNSGAKLAVANLVVSGAATTLTVAESLAYGGPLTQSSGTISIASGDTLSLSGTNSFFGGVVGAGTLAITGGATTIHSGVNLAVANLSMSGASTALAIGTIAAYAGNLTEGAGDTITLTSTNSLTLTGTDSLSGTLSTAGSLAVTGGHTTLNTGAKLAVANLVLSGDATTLSVAENLAYAGPLTENSGTISIASGDALTLSGTDSLFGSVVGGGTLSVAGNTTIHSGAVVAAADLLMSGVGKTLTVGTVAYAGALTESSGTVAVLGTFSLTGSGSFSSAVAGTGKLSVAGGATTINSGATLAISALSILGAATDVTLDENLTYAGAFAMAAGTLDLAAGNLTLTGADSFTGGTVDGAHILLTQGASATSVANLKIGGTVEWENTKTVNQTSQVTIGDSSGNIAFLDNTSTGIYDLLGNTGFSEGTSASSYILNAGLLEKTSGTGLGAIKPKITNTGTIKVTAGTLELKGAITGTGAETISGASTLQFDSTVAAGQTISFTGSGGTLDLASPQGFAGAIKGFDVGGGTNDALDIISGWSFTGASAGGTSATLGFVDGVTHVNVVLQGAYTGTFNHTAITGGTQITYTA